MGSLFFPLHTQHCTTDSISPLISFWGNRGRGHREKKKKKEGEKKFEKKNNFFVIILKSFIQNF